MWEKNETKQSIDRIQRFVETHKHKNIIIMEVPHRHDLIQESCVNKEVTRCNNRIRKQMKVHENAEVLHVNWLHKTWSAHEYNGKRIVEVIKRTIKVCRKKPISMKWKEETSIENRGTGEATEEGRHPSGNQTVSVQAEDTNSRRQENETEVKASRS